MTAAQSCRWEREIFIGEAKAVQHRFNAMFDRVAACAFECFIEMRLASHEALEFIALRMRHQFIHVLKFNLQSIAIRKRIHRCFEQRAFGGNLWVLFEISNRRAAADLHRARVWLQLARDDLEQRALAATVASHETDLFTRLNGAHCAVEEDAGSDGVDKIGKRNNRHWRGRRIAVERSQRLPRACEFVVGTRTTSELSFRGRSRSN